MRVKDKRQETRLCLLSDPPETVERVQSYFDKLDEFDVTVVPDAPFPDAEWCIVSADRLPDLVEVRPRLIRRTRLIAFGSPELLTPAFMFGCWDFLKDPWSPEELYLRVMRGEIEGRTVEHTIGESIEFDHEMLWTSRHAVELRPAEYRLLEALAAHAGDLVSRETLSLTLSQSLKSGSRSLDMNISNLRRKLRIVTAPESSPRIDVERGRGYRLAGWHGKSSPTVVK